jgi:type IV secretory pathway VirB9-like protein
VKSIMFVIVIALSLYALDPLTPVQAETVSTDSVAAQREARVVNYSETDIIPIRARLRYSTLIVLPPDEEIMDFTTGDKEFWIINGIHNLCYVHPAQAGIRSNLNLVTASGHVYSFLLTEVSKEPNSDSDLKVFVTFSKQSNSTGIGSSSYVRASEIEAYKEELTTFRNEAADQLREAQQKAEQQITEFKEDYPTKLTFDYTLDKKARRAPFLVSAIYHDDRFTYIQCAAREKPTVYEIKDRKPNLINFDYQNGVYVIPKILDSGYLVAGKKRVTFHRNSSNAEMTSK